MNQLPMIFPEDEDGLIRKLDANIRRVWKDGEWHFSVVDVIAALTGSPHPKTYWAKLKKKIEVESQPFPNREQLNQPFDQSERLDPETVTNPYQLKMEAPDGKMRKTDAATEEQLLRIIQSVPSPNAEPIKRWLARVGAERLQEARDPELGIQRSFNRAADEYERQGRDASWTNARLRGTITRRAFTDALQAAVMEGLADGRLFAQATNDVYEGVFHHNAPTLRTMLGLRSGANLRDNMPTVALYFVGIAEDLCREELGDAQMLTIEQAREIIRTVSGLVGASFDYLQDRLNRPFLPSGK